MAFPTRYLMFTRPPGEDVHELLVSGSDSVGVLHKITAVLSKNAVNFVSCHGQVDEAGSTFINAFFCDMAGAKVDMEHLKRELMALPFVTETKSVEMKGLMFENFMFPLGSMFAGRVLNVDALAFAEMEERLKTIFGSAGETMAYEQGKAYAESTVRDLEKYAVLAGARWDLANIQDLFRAEGWGVVAISEGDGGYDVSVRQPPQTKEEEGKGMGRFVVGLIVGMLEKLSGKKLHPGEVALDRKSGAFVFAVTDAPKQNVSAGF